MLQSARVSVRCARSSGISAFYRGSLIDPDRKTNFTPVTGDAWPAALLRLKSFDDLHRLWFVALKDKNLLLSERQAYRSYNVRTPWPHHGRLKKTRLTMKRILTVLTRRTIDAECLQARELLARQKKREFLEFEKLRLDREKETLELKLRSLLLDSANSLVAKLLPRAIGKNRRRTETVERELAVLRPQTTAMVKPVWQLQRKYSDLPGLLRWKPLWVRALEERRRSLVKTS